MSSIIDLCLLGLNLKMTRKNLDSTALQMPTDYNLPTWNMLHTQYVFVERVLSELPLNEKGSAETGNLSCQ